MRPMLSPMGYLFSRGKVHTEGRGVVDEHVEFYDDVGFRYVPGSFSTEESRLTHVGSINNEQPVPPPIVP